MIMSEDFVAIMNGDTVYSNNERRLRKKNALHHPQWQFLNLHAANMIGDIVCGTLTEHAAHAVRLMLPTPLALCVRSATKPANHGRQPAVLLSLPIMEYRRTSGASPSQENLLCTLCTRSPDQDIGLIIPRPTCSGCGKLICAACHMQDDTDICTTCRMQDVPPGDKPQSEGLGTPNDDGPRGAKRPLDSPTADDSDSDAHEDGTDSVQIDRIVLSIECTDTGIVFGISILRRHSI